MPKQDYMRQIDLNKKKLIKEEIKKKEEIAKLRSERAKVALALKEKQKELDMKKKEILSKIRSDEHAARLQRAANAKIEKQILEAQRKELARSNANLIEEKRMHKKQIRLFKKEIENTRSEYKRAKLQRELELKEKWAREREKILEEEVKLRHKQKAEKIKLSRKLDNEKLKLDEIRLKAQDAIDQRKAELNAQVIEFKSLNKEKKMKKELERAKDIAKVETQRESQRAELETALEEFKAKELALRSGVNKVSLDSKRKLKKMEKDLIKRIKDHKEEIRQLVVTNTEKEKEVQKNIQTTPGKGVEVSELEFISVFDEKEQISDDEKKLIEVLLIKEYGKPAARLLKKAEAEAKDTDIRKYRKKDIIFNNISKFREIATSESKPVDFKSIIKYMLVFNDKNFGEAEVDALYKRQIVALLRGESIEFGEGFLNPIREGGIRFVTYAAQPTSSVSSLFANEGRKEFNTLIKNKLKAGAAIQIAKGLIIAKDEDKVIRVFNDTNYIGV